ncbi:DUF1684 domain-containing protein [Agromyces soli]|uniref:DUF1684 domain-containing protein n=1 Tax=Agromyces soli TaxID=659012 RepID=A0ABY4B498_9MICO|nr:DUF1684 domain-containing protein [Agromyces soli]UOE27840.1 DUF1684 domain-containing protein [Agromyces soli]
MDLRAAHEDWVREREERVWGEWGIASLAATHWLWTEPLELEGVPGRWHAADGVVVGEAIDDLDGAALRLAPGEEAELAGILVRAFERDGSFALRVLDPGAAARRGVSRIERFPLDPAARVPGVVRRRTSEQSTTSVDGHSALGAFDAVVKLELDGRTVALAVQEDEGWYFAAFSDATSGEESHPFRFLRFPVPEGELAVVDFNRAYLPPCAFSDHYVCVLPVPGNRWSVPVRAGERVVG